MENADILRASGSGGPAVIAKVQRPRNKGSKIIDVDSTANWPDKFIATSGRLDSNGAIAPNSIIEFTGRKSGSNIEILNFEPGFSDVGNQIGDIVVVKPTTGFANRVANYFLEAANKFKNLVEYTYISSPNDLNDAQFLVPGKWRFGNNQQVGSTKNLPLANNTGVMETISHSGGVTRPGAHAWSYILQIFTALDGRMFIRNISTAESAGNIKFGVWQESAKEKAFAAARSDITYYQNSGANKVRTKDKIAERGNITIDTANNEFVIGEGVGLVQIAATVMTESITSAYLYLIVMHKPLGKPEKEMRQVLTEKVSSYCGASIAATIKVQPGDRVYVKHDCTARIRGHASEMSVREI